MIKTSDQMFLALREFLTNHKIDGDERRRVWDLLTALRGPDDGNLFPIKQNATVVLRYTLLGTSGDELIDGTLGADIHPDSEYKVKRRAELQVESGTKNFHFFNHLMRGFNAIGLKWDAENTVVPTFKKTKAKKRA